MALFAKSIDDLEEADLVALATNNIRERKMLEYKRDRVGASHGDRKEFLYDASSFANAQGGYLIFGMEDGAELAPIGINGDPAKEIVRLEQMVRSGIRPPLSGVHTISVKLGNGSSMLVMRIPKSWYPPHQVTYQNAFRFYSRDSNGKYQIDIDELRLMFALSSTISEKVRGFRADRMARIATDETPVHLLDGGILVLHVIPFDAFGLTSPFRFRDAAKMPGRFPPLTDWQTRQSQITVDGLLTTSNVEAPPQPQRAYTHVFRAGIIEAVTS
ncbi:MAG: ATP-binding protein, partial [Hyphomicrobiales bacterium]|nr:ATP-binding protein [Hyphomicrobiales bacterium]